MVLLSKLDLAELHNYEQAKELSITLLKKWLTSYKFKNWTTTDTNKKAVTEEMKKERAAEIAKVLNDTEKWHSHGRRIGIHTLRNELNLKIEDFEPNDEIRTIIRRYFVLLRDYMNRHKLYSCVHTREFF
jgi:hypothetical protein